MSALEIKPGKYRTRGGDVADVRRDTYSDVESYIGKIGERHCGWHKDGRVSMYCETTADLIERIEDEKAEERTVKVRKYGYGIDLASGSDQVGVAWPFPVAGNVTRASKPGNLRVPDDDFHVSYGAREEIRRIDGNMYEMQFCAAVKWCAQRNLKLIAMGEWDGPPIISEKEAAMNAKIARLEAENESLSRQLRSREINKEPTSTGKRWRWSPMV